MLENDVSKAVFEGNGATTSFPFHFKVWEKSQVKVSTLSPEGVGVPATPYSVVLDEEHDGGVITYPSDGGTPLPMGWRLVVLRDMPFTQQDDYISGTRFDPEVIETRFDQDCAERQQLKEGLDRAITVPAGGTKPPEDFALELLDASKRAVAAAGDAAVSASNAEGSANSATEEADRAQRIVDGSVQRIETATTDSLADIKSASDSQQQIIANAGTEAAKLAGAEADRAQSEADRAAAQIPLVTVEGDKQIKRVADAGTDEVGRVQTEGAVQIQRASDEADRSERAADRAEAIVGIGPATASTLGLVKIGSGITVTPDGVISAGKVDIATPSTAGIVVPDGSTLTVKEDGKGTLSVAQTLIDEMNASLQSKLPLAGGDITGKLTFGGIGSIETSSSENLHGMTVAAGDYKKGARLSLRDENAVAQKNRAVLETGDGDGGHTKKFEIVPDFGGKPAEVLFQSHPLAQEHGVYIPRSVTNCVTEAPHGVARHDGSVILLHRDVTMIVADGTDTDYTLKTIQYTTTKDYTLDVAGYPDGDYIGGYSIKADILAIIQQKYYFIQETQPEATSGAMQLWFDTNRSRYYFSAQGGTGWEQEPSQISCALFRFTLKSGKISNWHATWPCRLVKAEDLIDAVGKVKASGHPLGYEFASLYVPEGCLLCNGALYDKATYADLFAFKKKEGRVLSEAEWQRVAARDGGYCASFSDNGTTFRVPKVAPYVKITNDKSTVRHHTSAGLPNITGWVGNGYRGVFQDTVQGGALKASGLAQDLHKDWGGEGTVTSYSVAVIDASGSNPIYGRSEAVQPESTSYLWVVQAFGVATNVGNADVGDALAKFGDLQATKVDAAEAAHASRPATRSEEIPLLASGSTYIAPDDGFMALRGNGALEEMADVWLDCYGISNSNRTRRGSYATCCIPCKKGESVYAAYGPFESVKLWFFRCVGNAK